MLVNSVKCVVVLYLLVYFFSFVCVRLSVCSDVITGVIGSSVLESQVAEKLCFGVDFRCCPYLKHSSKCKHVHSG